MLRAGSPTSSAGHGRPGSGRGVFTRFGSWCTPWAVGLAWEERDMVDEVVDDMVVAGRSAGMAAPPGPIRRTAWWAVSLDER